MYHAITAITLIPPDGMNWRCACGTQGTCPRPIAAETLFRHLTGKERPPGDLLWISPGGTWHLQPAIGPCATCGRRHEKNGDPA